ncbi:aminotransferase class I/II-fold pyridoxal phosphate-dependent enzyme [Urechidicola croceus]|uniref:8-amino-7-oxononanoate synthase n=1 Tax=Urechidicola croceus TaxID=1850246 RepID=A0A1D8P8L2_9FLAO|nr:pyridoxal phosphate-dependent aminotransferase family protein [Urechidicola croceus]AOW20926.1 8-amino-7-oxononanoate synthase [Urechidicola croceus]
MNFPKKLYKKLTNREQSNSLRKLNSQSELIDFSSNDYLGFSKSETIFQKAHQYLINNKIHQNGSTGSRLLSGNHKLYEEVENTLCKFHNSEAATIFNSGYDANIGFFSSVPQRGDTIIYDEFIHASIRDGIKMSNAKSYKFKHNDLGVLEELLKRLSHTEFISESHKKEQDEMLKQVQHDGDIYVVTESVFSMDGDSPDLVSLLEICKKYNTYLIIDEAHALGVFGKNGCGLIQELGLENEIFARIITFGKGLGCHGAAILGSKELKSYLVNFARSFIYTTALPPHSLATIKIAYEYLISSSGVEKSQKLKENIQYFNQQLKTFPFGEMSEGQRGKPIFIPSNSAIHCCIISGNENVKKAAQFVQEKGFDVKPILSPTVPEGQERLRFCLHSYNSQEEISKVLKLLATFVLN